MIASLTTMMANRSVDDLLHLRLALLQRIGELESTLADVGKEAAVLKAETDVLAAGMKQHSATIAIAGFAPMTHHEINIDTPVLLKRADTLCAVSLSRCGDASTLQQFIAEASATVRQLQEVRSKSGGAESIKSTLTAEAEIMEMMALRSEIEDLEKQYESLTSARLEAWSGRAPSITKQR
jgi:hypothetical protein